jgi:hypothetical protein
LRDDTGTHGFDLFVDFLYPPRVRLQGLDTGCGHLREKDVCRHDASSSPILEREHMPTFTRAQAEALLPKVRPLLEDLQRRKASYDRRPTDPVAKEINALLLEIAHLGVDVKDPDQGLIDFPALRRGREVLLCWKLGEGDRISYWHDVETGFAGRKLIED